MRVMVAAGIDIPDEILAELCRRYEIHSLSLFGSLSRGQGHPDSDADILVEYRPHHHQSLFDFGNLREELSAIFGRRVDLVSRHGLSPHIGPQILREARLFYAVE